MPTNNNATLCGFFVCALLWANFTIAAEKPLANLQGKWKVTKASINGKELKDPQISNSTLEFIDDVLIMQPANGTTRERFKVEPEVDSKPAAIHVTRVEPNQPQQGWQIYELKEGRLRMAFFDALKQRPKSFDPQPKLIVMELKKVERP